MAEDTPIQSENESDPLAQKRLQNLFSKGFAAFERGNLDMAIDLLFSCVELSPGFFRARKFLRAAAIQRFTRTKPNALSLKLAQLKGLPGFAKTKMLLQRQKPDAALLAAERMIQQAPLCIPYVCLAADCAVAAEQMEGAIMYLETALQLDMQNADLMMHLAQTYRTGEQWIKAREVLNALVNLKPLDARILQLLKDTDARLAVAGTWDASQTGDSFRKLIKDQAGAEKIDMQNKAVIDGSDADIMIAEQRAKIEAEPKNLNYYRGLARLLQQQKRFDEAVEVIDAAKINPTDPELDRQLSALRLLSYDARIEAAQAAGDSTQKETLEHERNQYMFDDLVLRVERYPNDLRLRFELGMQYLLYESYDDAIQQLQLAQRSPKERSEALFGLARCFRLKGQRDMATMQLETAIEQLPVMDDMRKKILFELGELAEEMGNTEKAFTIYREIYGADISYRDISEKMERIYKLRGEAKKD